MRNCGCAFFVGTTQVDLVTEFVERGSVGDFLTLLEELDDEHLHMGVSEVRGLLMVSPLLSEHISAELHREAVSLRERRKLREERRSSQGKASGSGGGGGGGDGNKGDQSRIDRLASENNKLKEQLEGAGMELPKTGGPHKQRGGGKGGAKDA